MAFPEGIWILALTSLVVSALGWKKFLYFISLGYGFSIAAMGLALVVMYRAALAPHTLLLALLLVAYGCRLGGFLLHRELRSTSYRKELPSLTKTSHEMGVGVKVTVWLSVVALYVCQVSPVFYRLDNAAAGGELWAYVGAGIMLLALILESVADHEKSTAKKLRPDRFCDTGLYRMVRCPNYFAEILFWTGCIVSGIGALTGWQGAVAAVGYLCIVYIMFGGARRLEIRQNKRYGADSAYQAYVARVPIIIPLIPLYTVEKYTFLRG